MKEFTIYFSGSTTIAAPDYNAAVTAFWKHCNRIPIIRANRFNIHQVGNHVCQFLSGSLEPFLV